MNVIVRAGLRRSVLQIPLRVPQRWNATSSQQPKQPQPPPPPPQDAANSNVSESSLLDRLNVGGFVSSAESNFARAGVALNRITGYDEIQGLKQMEEIAHARQAAREAKAAHDAASKARAASQREVNDLLGRKATWSESDVSRFTALVREDHALEQAELRAQAAVAHSEEAVEKALSSLTKSILARYHEEQVWSDKIRQLSTYGQLGVMAVNVLVFVLAILIVEPWKRKRLGETFERRVEELEKEHRLLFEQNSTFVRSTLESQGRLLQSLAATDAPLSVESVEDIEEAQNTILAAKLTAGQRQRLEAVLLSSVGGAIGAGLVSMMIHFLKG
ncbi:Mdm33 family-domain-containing protein [Auriculariales sp. MPI-PUGE-AT-0066]|nr:Mdm33 family-domain-containing protein [Auriculariales sp. MPI-PUGE-AT-0066]